ncbi:hypothetical protein LCGC14_0289270 [marine sediment metagenome]|uniref:Uncharacterized protein n=1 Tax=marine sediment metagenome TaxID=412755 RepID=A0A0F9TTU3_9ZZZZ
MPGTTETMRFAGMPDSGYPAEFLLDGSTSLRVRWVAPLLVNMAERSTDLLKYTGGVEQFQYTHARIEWVEDDPWNRRPTIGSRSAASVANEVQDLTVTGAAHRFPVGTVLFNRQRDEFVRVTGHVDGDTLSIMRDITGRIDETSVAWVATDEVFVAGFSMHENDNWVFRPTSLTTMPYNYSQVHSVGVQATFRMIETQQYGLQGNDLDKQAADTVAEQFVTMEQEFVHGDRFAGTSAIPALMGGIFDFITAANGAQVTDLSDAALVRSDIDDILQSLFYEVGGDKMAKTIVCAAWPKRKLSSFFSGAERLGPGTGQTAGVVVDRLNTDFGVLDILMHTAVRQDELYLLRQENHRMGHHGTLGRPQLRQLPPSSTGPRIQQAFYADVSAIHSGPRAEARIHGMSTTT